MGQTQQRSPPLQRDAGPLTYPTGPTGHGHRAENGDHSIDPNHAFGMSRHGKAPKADLPEEKGTTRRQPSDPVPGRPAGPHQTQGHRGGPGRQIGRRSSGPGRRASYPTQENTIAGVQAQAAPASINTASQLRSSAARPPPPKPSRLPGKDQSRQHQIDNRRRPPQGPELARPTEIPCLQGVE